MIVPGLFLLMYGFGGPAFLCVVGRSLRLGSVLLAGFVFFVFCVCVGSPCVFLLCFMVWWLESFVRFVPFRFDWGCLLVMLTGV